jgi:hypothetical protein
MQAALYCIIIHSSFYNTRQTTRYTEYLSRTKANTQNIINGKYNTVNANRRKDGISLDGLNTAVVPAHSN